MQPAQGAVAAHKHSVQKLHLRRKDDRNIPSLRKDAPKVHTLSIFSIVLRDDIGMMFQNRLIHVENITNLLDVLIDDRGIRNDNNNSFFIVFLRMTQGKPHTCKGLTTACRNA